MKYLVFFFVLCLGLIASYFFFFLDDKDEDEEVLEIPSLRIAIASDHHFGQDGVVDNMDILVDSLNYEKESKGLDYSFHLGDLVNGRPELLPILKKKSIKM